MDPDRELIQQLEQLAVGLVGITALALRESPARPELTLLQWRALLLIGGSAAPVRMGDLARMLPASPSSATRVVDRLSSRGLVKSLRRSVDGRGVWLRITRKGRLEYEAVLNYRREMLSLAVARLPAENRQKPTTLAAMAGLIGRWPWATRLSDR
jgi:DNA-binding MarR family transcriptional regulator